MWALFVSLARTPTTHFRQLPARFNTRRPRAFSKTSRSSESFSIFVREAAEHKGKITGTACGQMHEYSLGGHPQACCLNSDCDRAIREGSRGCACPCER